VPRGKAHPMGTSWLCGKAELRQKQMAVTTTWKPCKARQRREKNAHLAKTHAKNRLAIVEI
jgi:hypothetical protein